MQISDFFPEVYLKAPGVPKARALLAGVRVVRDFCDRTHVWTAEAEVTLDPATNSYLIPVVDGTEVAMNGVLGGNQAGVPVTIGIKEELPAAWRQAVPSDTVVMVVPSRSALLVYPQPATTAVLPLTVDLALRPALNATFCDSVIGDWERGIVGGILAELFRDTGRPWSAPEQVAEMLERYEDAVGSARVAKAKGHTTQPIYMSIPCLR